MCTNRVEEKILVSVYVLAETQRDKDVEDDEDLQWIRVREMVSEVCWMLVEILDLNV